MRWTLVAAVTLICWSGYGVCSAADRHWQTGTWGDVGLKRDPRVQGRAVGRSPFWNKSGDTHTVSDPRRRKVRD